MSIPSDLISATVETLILGGALVVMKIFRRSDRNAAPALTVLDVFGCLLAGSIFGVLTTFRWNTIRCKTVLMVIIITYFVAAFVDALVRRARRSTDEH
jgi:hypothetical protein